MTATAQDLLAEQAKLEALGQKIIADANKAAEQRDAKTNERLEALEKQFTAQLKDLVDSIAKANPKLSPLGIDVDPTGKKKNAFCLARQAHAVATGDWSVAPFEAEVAKEIEKTGWRQRAMSLGIDTAGGHLVPQEVSDKVLEKLLPASVAMRLGARMEHVGNVAALTFNRETETALAQWVGEMLTATKRDLKWAQFTVSPKALSARADISNLLQLLGNNAAENRFVNSARRQFGLAIDKAILIGVSGDKGPIGVANTLGVGTSPSASLTYDKLIAFQTTVQQANVVGTSNGWAASVSQWDAIRKLKDTANQPLLYRDVAGTTPERVLGAPILTTTQLGTTGANTLIYGYWEYVALYHWFGGLMLQRSNTSDNALDNDLTRVALRMYADVGVDYPEAFVTASD